MLKVAELPNDNSCLTWEVPVYAKLFQVDPVISSQMVELEGTMVQKDEKMIEEVVFESIEWYGMSRKKSNQLFFPMGNYFLEKW